MPTIALVDDDIHILASVSMALEAEGYRTQSYTNGVSALEGMQQRPPDAAILDIKMPRMDGLELLRRLRQISDLPVIFLTSRDNDVDELFGFKMGADDYIRKPFSQRVLIERVKIVVQRAQPVDTLITNDGESRVVERGKLVLDPDRHACTWDSSPIRLTVTEFRILEALAQRPSIVKNRNELVAAIYDDDIHVDSRAIDTHIKRLRQKFRTVDGEFDAIETLYGIGYRFNLT